MGSTSSRPVAKQQVMTGVFDRGNAQLLETGRQREKGRDQVPNISYQGPSHWPNSSLWASVPTDSTTLQQNDTWRLWMGADLWNLLKKAMMPAFHFLWCMLRMDTGAMISEGLSVYGLLGIPNHRIHSYRLQKRLISQSFHYSLAPSGCQWCSGKWEETGTFILVLRPVCMPLWASLMKRVTQLPHD